MKPVRAKKNLGQHFLKDIAIADRIAASIEEYKHLTVLEVGPGMGILTRCLLDRGFDLYVVEIDSESVAYLRDQLPTSFIAEGRLVEGDILRIPPENLIPGRPESPFVMIGNYPYNISGRLFYHIFELRHRIPCVGGMLQKEVAERITSLPGGRQYGILSVLLQSRYNGEFLFTVDKEQFQPEPKVDGGVLRLSWNQQEKLPCDERLFVEVVKNAFNQRRKTLKNALKRLFLERGLEYIDLPEEVARLLPLRAEKLSVQEYIALTQFLASHPESPL